jgi:hypothetical protein
MESRKITVLLSDEDFARFDAYCGQQGFKKSSLIARLIRDHLDREQFETQIPLPLAMAERRAGTRMR